VKWVVKLLWILTGMNHGSSQHCTIGSTRRASTVSFRYQSILERHGKSGISSNDTVPRDSGSLVHSTSQILHIDLTWTRFIARSGIWYIRNWTKKDSIFGLSVELAIFTRRWALMLKLNPMERGTSKRGERSGS
jgi:hypothetical protein